jgi:hypothetical protein
VNTLLLYLASVVLTALVEIGVILIVNGDRYSKIHGILGDRNQTIGLVLILVAFGLTPVLNVGVTFVLIVMWGFDEL